jgi:hypothetical protein
VPWVLGLIVDGNCLQPEWPGPGPIAFLMKKESGLSRSMMSFHANSKVWITEIKAWMYWFGASL